MHALLLHVACMHAPLLHVAWMQRWISLSPPYILTDAHTCTCWHTNTIFWKAVKWRLKRTVHWEWVHLWRHFPFFQLTSEKQWAQMVFKKLIWFSLIFCSNSGFPICSIITILRECATSFPIIIHLIILRVWKGLFIIEMLLPVTVARALCACIWPFFVLQKICVFMLFCLFQIIKVKKQIRNNYIFRLIGNRCWTFIHLIHFRTSVWVCRTLESSHFQHGWKRDRGGASNPLYKLCQGSACDNRCNIKPGDECRLNPLHLMGFASEVVSPSHSCCFHG